MKRRYFLTAGGALTLFACATPPRGSFDAAQAPAPDWRVGDSWTFRRTDGFNNVPRGMITRSVDSIDQDGIRIVTRNDAGIALDYAMFPSPGVELSGTLSEDGPVRGVFMPHLLMYDFPLYSGKTWQQSLLRTDANGLRTFMTVSVRVDGWEAIRAGGATHRALVIRRTFMLGPRDPFSGPLHREELEWYAPELRGAAHMRTKEYLVSWHRRFTWIPGDRFIYQLEAFHLT